MKFFKKNENKHTEKLPMNDKVKKGFRAYSMAVVACTLLSVCAVPAFAAGNDPLTVIDNLSDFIFGLIRAVGMILLGFGIVQVGLSLKSHDPSQRATLLRETLVIVAESIHIQLGNMKSSGMEFRPIKAKVPPANPSGTQYIIIINLVESCGFLPEDY